MSKWFRNLKKNKNYGCINVECIDLRSFDRKQQQHYTEKPIIKYLKLLSQNILNEGFCFIN